MKTKKFIALIIASVMLFASVAVNAAPVYLDEDDYIGTDEYPTVEEILTRTPSVSVSVVPMSVDAAIETGIITSAKKNPKTEDNTDCYKATYTVTGLGDLYYALIEEEPWDKYAWVKLFDVTITIPAFEAKQWGVLSGSLNGTTFTHGDITKLIWNTGSSDQSKLYPAGTPEMGVLAENTTLTAEVIYALNEGATVDVTPALSVTYDVKTADGNPSPDVVGTATNKLTMAPIAATTYTIAFKTYDGASTINDDTTYDDGDPVTAPTAPARTGYTFSHWSETQGGSAATVLTTATADKTYYAVYTAIPVSSITLDKAALALTVGNNGTVAVSSVLPENALDKTYTWSSDATGVATVEGGTVTAVAVGTAHIRATANDGSGVYGECTVTVSAAAPADIVPDAADQDTYSSASVGLHDASGTPVTIDSSRSYGAAKFENVILDNGEYVYKIFATGINKTTGLEETHSWDVVNEKLEIAEDVSVSFIAIVRSATHTITSVVLKAFAKSE